MILLLLAAAAAQPADTPRGFMERLYANYRHSDYSPFTHPERVFAPALLAAIKEDSRLAHGEVGYLDGDPICQCQDSSGMHPLLAKVTQKGREKADVAVSIRWPHDKPTAAHFSLVRTKAGWRIADVSSADEPSLRRAIERSNREARKRRR